MKVTNTSDQTLYVRVYNAGVPNEVVTEDVSEKLNMSVRYTDLEGNTIDKTEINQGTEFKCHFTIKNPGQFGDYKNLAFTQMIPAGWEIRNTRLNEGSSGTNSKIDYLDIRDDRINAYFDLRRYKTVILSFEMHATFKGAYKLPPVICTEMYDATIKAQIGGTDVLVK